jgi:AraC family transcriptional regulator, regulatory protein of adaptative response / DNA-3-methyladenine glycosylase II
VLDDFDHCYRAVQARDPRFDGWFVTAVTSTGVYCRPSCPARTPGPGNVRFYPTAAAAQASGFRACLRCRPDAAPGSPEWNVRRDVVGRAMRLIADGVVDREGVGGLARRLGYGSRQLHRLLVGELGAGPIALARSQRAHTARLLIETTELPMADVAFAAGFASIRQFNDTVRAVLGRTPTALRERVAGGSADGGRSPKHVGAPGALALRLPYRRPMAVAEVLSFLGHRAVAGVEVFESGVYRRSLRLPHGHGVVTLSPGGDHVAARLVLGDLRDLSAAVGRCRRLLDLDADPEAIDAALGEDPMLRPLVARVPGRRVPGSADGFELAVRAVVGQQVSLAGACTVVGRLASAGPPLAFSDPIGEPGSTPLTTVFPSPAELLGAPDGAFAMPAARRGALRGLAEAVAGGVLDIDPGADSAAVTAGLLGLRGIGEWTAAYVAMRALGDPDAFPAGDLGLRRALERLGAPGGRGCALTAAGRWRPWRAYAAAHLWALDPDTVRPDAMGARTPEVPVEEHTTGQNKEDAA